MSNPAIRKFAELAPEMPEKQILLRLGFNLHRTVISPEQRAEFRRCMCEAFALCRPCGRYAVMKVVTNDGNRIICEGGFCVESRDFARRFPEMTHLWAAAATVGGAIVERIAREKNDIAVAAICDATASESADAAMDFLQGLATGELRRERLALLSRRFSPGYGDMDLSHQEKIYRLLRLEEIGLSLTDNNFFVPEKSVSAFGAIQESSLS